MGRSGRSSVHRLPKAERTPPQPKVRLLPRETPVAPPSSSSPSPSPPPASPSPAAPATQHLNDHCLQLVLRFAGLKAVFTALNVCRQWRQVAAHILRTTHTLDLSALYRVGKARDTPPTDAHVCNALSKFSALRTLQLRNWPYMDTHPHVLRTCVQGALPHLRVLHLEAVAIDAHVMTAAFIAFPQLEQVHLVRSETIDDHLLSKMASHKTQHNTALSKLVVSRAHLVLGPGVSALIAACFAPVIRVTHCSALRSVETGRQQQPLKLQQLTLSSNVRLSHVDLQNVHVPDLNVSQCTSLSNLSIEVQTVENLNLSGCKVLCGFRLGATSVPVSALKTINVYGARRIHANTLRSLYASPHVTYSSLTKIDLNGCSIDDLVLDKYQSLQYLDCSGCRSLSRLIIRECWELARVCCNGKRLPLTHVELMVPSSCIVEGMRAEWNWLCAASHKSVFYTADVTR